MAELAFYDGRIIDPNEPVVRVTDRAYQFGDGVYEAWMLDHRRQILRKEHLDRFERSAAALGIVPTASRRQIEAWADQLVEASGLVDGMLYFQWSRGWQWPRNHIPAENIQPILSGFIKSRTNATWARPFRVRFAVDERQSFVHIKTMNLLGSVRALSAAVADGFDDVLLTREIGSKTVVTEASRSNAFFVRRGALITAPLGTYLLPGITRSKILAIGAELGLTVEEKLLTPQEVLECNEAFLTSCTALDPIVSIDGHPLGQGFPGPIFDRINERYRDYIACC